MPPRKTAAPPPAPPPAMNLAAPAVCAVQQLQTLLTEFQQAMGDLNAIEQGEHARQRLLSAAIIERDHASRSAIDARVKGVAQRIIDEWTAQEQ